MKFMAHSALAESPIVNEIAEKILQNQRLSRQDAEILYQNASLQTLGHLAHLVRLRLHPEAIVTYVGDRNINYSNICICACKFCAYFRPPKHPEGYVIERETLKAKIEETLRLGGTQILLQGGFHPDLPFSWYEELLQWMRATWPKLHIHAFSAPEIHFWSELYQLSVSEILTRLQKAGLDSLPGGGAEVLADSVRSQVSPNKCTVDQWFAVMHEAHKLGIKTTATMMFGHLETDSDLFDHLFRLRAEQEQTKGYTAFIPWTFQPNNTALQKEGKQIDSYPAPAYLRLLAISRLILDNVPNIQVSWVTMGPQTAQIALFYGANDFGSLMLEENVVAATGVSFSLSRKDIHRIIENAGFIPKQRTMDYTILDPQPVVEN